MLDMSDVTITCTKVSPRKIEANRENAKKSTGPRTLRGKARSRRNAIKLGIFSAGEAFVMGEKEPEYNHHRIEMLRSLNPSNHLQLRYAGLIIAASWNINRISWAERQEHWWTIDIKREKHRKSCARKRRWREENGEPDEPDPRFKKPREWVQTLMLLSGEGSPATRFERLQKYKMQLEMSMNRNQNQFRKLRKDVGDEGREPTKLTEEMIARWEKECDVFDNDADEEEEVKQEKEAVREAQATEEVDRPAGPSESETGGAAMLQNVARDVEKSKTNPPISESLAGPGFVDGELERTHTGIRTCPPAKPGAIGGVETEAEARDALGDSWRGGALW